MAGVLTALILFLTAEHQSTEVFLLALLVALFGWAWVTVTRGNAANPIEIDKLFLFQFGMYTVMPLFLSSAAPDRVGGDFLELRTTYCVLIGLGGVVLGSTSGFAPWLAKTDLRLDGGWQRREARLAAMILIGVGGGLLAILVARVGLETYTASSYVEAYNAEDGKGYLAIGAYFVQIGLLVLLLDDARGDGKLPWRILALFALVCAAYLRTGRRRFVLETGIAVLVCIHFYFRRIPLRMLVVGAAIVGVVFAAVGQARSRLSEGWEGMSSYMREDMSGQDLWHVTDEYTTVVRSLRETTRFVPSVQNYRLGQSFVDAVEILVPKVIHPQRPLAASQWLVWYVDPELAAKGGGFAFSMMAEGYLNWGYVGVFLVTFLEGILLRGVILFRRLRPESKSRMLLYSVATSFVIELIRCDSATLLKLGLAGAGVPAIVVAMWLGRRKEESPATSEA